MTSLDVIRTLTTRFTTEGADDATSKAKGFATAHENLAGAADKTTTAFDRNALSFKQMAASLDAQDIVGKVSKGFDDASASGLSFSKVLAGLGVIGVGAAIFDFVGKINNQMLELETNARKAGTSLADFQAIQFAASSVGISNDKTASTLEDINKKLFEMKTDGGDIGKFLDANNIKWKDATGNVVSMTQYLGIAATLLQKASSYPQMIKAADILGVAEFVSLLERGPEGLSAMLQKAKDLGIILDDELINKNADFAREWNATAAQWSAMFRSAIINVTSSFNDLIDKAKGFNEWMEQQRIHVPGVTIVPEGEPDFIDQLGLKIANLFNPRFGMQIGAAVDTLNEKLTALEPVLSTVNDWIRAIGADSATAAGSIDKEVASLIKLQEATLKVAIQGINPLKFAPDEEKNKPRTPIEVVQDTITKRTEEFNRETAAIGENTSALAAAKLMGDLDAAAKREHKTVTAEMRAEWEKLTGTYRAASEVFKQATAQDKANFDLQTVFLTNTERHIADVQRQLHTSGDWQNFMNDGLSATMRLTDAMKQLSDAAGSFASGFLKDISHGVSATTALHNALTRLSDTLIDMISKKLQEKALGMLIGLLPTPGGDLTFGGTTGGVGSTGTGGIGSAHSGGIIGLDALPMRFVHPAYFDDAPRFQGGGIVGGETPIIAHRGEGVFTPGQMAAMGGSSGPPQVNVAVHNYSQANAQVKQTPSGDLHVVIRDMVRGTVIDDISNNGPITRAHTQRFGLDPTRGMAV
jgi:hypothetical protein